MILAAALFWLVQAPAVEPPVIANNDSEIVVIAQKLKSWRGVYKQRKGKFVCTTKRSTGDKLIDQIGCDALLQCAAPRSADISAVYAANKDRQVRERLMEPINTIIGECLVETRDAGVAALAEQRAAGGLK